MTWVNVSVTASSPVSSTSLKRFNSCIHAPALPGHHDDDVRPAAGRPHAEKHPEAHPAHGPGQQRGEDGIADDRILEQLEDGDSHAGQDRHVQRPEREPEGQRLPAPQQQDGVADAEHPCRGYPPRIIADQGEPEHAAARELIRHRQRDDRETRQQRDASVTVQVRLKPGNNVVRMGSPYCWAPDIDCFTLKKIE